MASWVGSRLTRVVFSAINRRSMPYSTSYTGQGRGPSEKAVEPPEGEGLEERGLNIVGLRS